jgi:hypothetical protein
VGLYITKVSLVVEFVVLAPEKTMEDESNGQFGNAYPPSMSLSMYF